MAAGGRAGSNGGRIGGSRKGSLHPREREKGERGEPILMLNWQPGMEKRREQGKEEEEDGWNRRERGGRPWDLDIQQTAKG